MVTVAFIPARGGSKRFPRKNVALLKGRPLISYAISAAKDSGVYDHVYVSSDDDEILSIAEDCGAETIRRPDELAADDVNVPTVVLHAIEHLEKKGMDISVISILLSTSPLRTASHIKEAHKKFTDSGAEFLMSMTDYFHNPFRCLTEVGDRIKPYFGDKYLKRDQALPKVFVNDGSIFFAKTEAFKKEKTWYGKDLAGYYIPPLEAIDINEPETLKLVEFLMDS